MITKKDISKGAIGNTHISKSAEIDPSKLKGDKVGSILIADRDGKFVPRKVRGDATLLPSGEFRISAESPAGVVTEEEVRGAGGLIGKDIKHGSTLVGERDGTPKEVNVGTGANAIPQRDSSGNLNAETADNADKLDNQDGTYYTNTSNHTSGTSSAISTSGGGIAGTSQPFPTHLVIANNTTGQSNTSSYTVEHGFGSHPLSVQLNETTDDSGTYVDGDEIEAHVSSTNTTTTIQFSKSNILFRARLVGL